VYFLLEICRRGFSTLMGSGSVVTNFLGVGANNLSGVTLGVDLLFGVTLGDDFFMSTVYIISIAKNSVFVLWGQKDKSTLSALVVSNFAIDGKTLSD
jgi:hypothetical protein